MLCHAFTIFYHFTKLPKFINRHQSHLRCSFFQEPPDQISGAIHIFAGDVHLPEAPWGIEILAVQWCRCPLHGQYGLYCNALCLRQSERGGDVRWRVVTWSNHIKPMTQDIGRWCFGLVVEQPRIPVKQKIIITKRLTRLDRFGLRPGISNP